MTEQERIRKMVTDGTLTQEEADRLLSVLAEMDRADQALDAGRDALEREAEATAVSGTPQPEPQPAPRPAAQAPSPAGPAVDRAVDPGVGPAVDPSSRPAAAGDDGTAWVAGLREAGRAAAEAAGAAFDAVGRSVDAATSRVSAPDAAPDAAPDPAATERAAGAAPRVIAPEDTRWLHVVLAAGDLEVRVDPSLERPEIRGDTESVTLEPSEDGFRLSGRPGEADASWVDRFLRRMRSTDLQVRIPAGYGVDLRVTAGDIELRDVPYLRGRVTAGDIEARGLRGLDFRTSAGDLDLELDPGPGAHYLEATAGDVNLRLAAGASVTLDGRVSIGDASASGAGLQGRRQGLGAALEGTLGTGEASLTVRITTGDLDVRSDHG